MVIGKFFSGFRQNVPWRDRINANIVLRPFNSQRFGEHDHTALGGDLKSSSFDCVMKNNSWVPDWIVAIGRWIEDRICELTYGSDFLIAKKMSIALSDPNFVPPCITFNSETGFTIQKSVGSKMSSDGVTDYKKKLTKLYRYLDKVERNANGVLLKKGKLEDTAYTDFRTRKGKMQPFRLIDGLNFRIQTLVDAASSRPPGKIKWTPPHYKVRVLVPASKPAAKPSLVQESDDPALEKLLRSPAYMEPAFQNLAKF